MIERRTSVVRIAPHLDPLPAPGKSSANRVRGEGDWVASQVELRRWLAGRSPSPEVQIQACGVGQGTSKREPCSPCGEQGTSCSGLPAVWAGARVGLLDDEGRFRRGGRVARHAGG